MREQVDATLHFLAGRPDLFDRITKNGQGGRVGWSYPKPRGYDSKVCLPWSQVRGRYWYPWRAQAD
jgi:hypothetical protein